MRQISFIAITATFVVTGTAFANDVDLPSSEPVQLTAEQMDGITAAGGNALPYGKLIIAVTGKPFGGLIGPAKKAGTSAHSNYAGGARALVEAVLGPGHPVP